LGQRSRKRGRRERPTAPVATATPAPTAERAPGAAKAAGPDRMGQGRSEQRNAAVRATLKPLQPGERPWALKIAVVIAVLVGAGDLIDVLFGGTIKFGHNKAGVGGVVLFSVMMLVCAVGMWKLRYWAVLGFQAILAIVVLLFSLLLIRANNVLGLVVGVVVVGGGGFLFYKLVRVLSRLQMPEYPGR
jgi:hypothetical protein